MNYSFSNMAICGLIVFFVYKKYLKGHGQEIKFLAKEIFICILKHPIAIIMTCIVFYIAYYPIDKDFLPMILWLPWGGIIGTGGLYLVAFSVYKWDKMKRKMKSKK